MNQGSDNERKCPDLSSLLSRFLLFAHTAYTAAAAHRLDTMHSFSRSFSLRSIHKMPPPSPQRAGSSCNRQTGLITPTTPPLLTTYHTRFFRSSHPTKPKPTTHSIPLTSHPPPPQQTGPPSPPCASWASAPASPQVPPPPPQAPPRRTPRPHHTRSAGSPNPAP